MSRDDNIFYLPDPETGDFDPDLALKNATGKLNKGMVIGWDKEGHFYFSSSTGDARTILWLLEITRNMLLNAGDIKP